MTTDEIFSRVDKGQLIQTALIKTTGYKHQKNPIKQIIE